MQKFWRLFKLPLLVTVIAMVVDTIVGIIMVTSLARSGGVRLEERAAQLGQGLAIITVIILAPFWIYAVLQAGKENREALKKANAKSKSSGTKKRK